MSDDEDYYDDDDEYIYYEEGPLDVVDDLAEHTMHSPVWQDDPKYDMLEYFSDWEYYSDDYYDEDSALKKPNVQLATATNLAHGINPLVMEGSNKGKVLRKRRDNEDRHRPGYDSDANRRLGMLYPKVVWKAGPSLHKPPLVDPNDAETVALFENWRERLDGDQKRVISSHEKFTNRNGGAKTPRTRAAKSETLHATNPPNKTELIEQPNRGEPPPHPPDGMNSTKRKRKALDSDADERKPKAVRSSARTNQKENIEDTPSRSTRSRTR